MDKSISKFISALPHEEKEMAVKLRDIVLSVNPSFKEKFAYGVPYYYIKKRVCFIWPTSIPRSGLSGGVMFGISQGVILKKKFDIIRCGTCKVVGWIQYFNSKDIKPEIIKDILVEAVIFQEMQNLNF
jgi:hypothetical protein